MTVNSEKPVLVTGATGLLGNRVVRLLVDRGDRVRVVVRENSLSRPLEGLPVEIARGDLRDGAAVAAACGGCRLVIHAAAEVRIGSSRPDRFRESNVVGTRHVVAGSLAAGARLVHVSTTDTLGMGRPGAPADEETPFDLSTATPYSLSKLEAESSVHDGIAKGLDAVVVHPSFLLGPGDWKPSSGAMLLAVARGVGWLAPRGHGSFADARDVAAGVLAAADLGKRGRHYLLAGETISYLEAWCLFATASGRRPPLGHLGPVLSFLAGRGGDLVGAATGREPPVNSVALRAARGMRLYSSRRAEEELGYRRRPLTETIADTLAWFVEHGYLRASRKPN